MPFELGQSIRAQVGSASVAAMELAQPAEAQERTIETITAEIEQLKARGGEVIIEIGKRLIEAKERLPHGEWAAWLADRVEFSERTAQEFMKIAREWSNPRTLADLGKSKALKLLLLPTAERDEFLETHDVPNMSTRELEQAIRERDEAKAAAEYSEKKLGELSRAFDESQTALENEHARTLELNTKIKELESAPKEVYKDEAAIQKAAAEARAAAEAEWSAKERELMDKLAKAEAKAKKAAEKAKTAGEDAAKQSAAELDEARQAQANAEAEAEWLREALEQAKREQAKASIAGDADLALVQEYGGQIVQFANKLGGMLKKARNNGNEKTAELVRKALSSLAEQIGGLAK